MMNQFKDKIAIVTGAASGIGRALCEELGRNEAMVIAADINAEGSRLVASNIRENGGRAEAASLDVSSAEDVQHLVDKIVSEHGRLDYMFNNAGIAIAGEVRDISIDQWRRIVDVNLFGVIYGATAAYSAMIKQGFGHIVNTASLAGLVGSPAMVPYCMTKYAVVGLSTSLRAEAEGLGVHVSAICPGFIQTGIFDAAIYNKTRKEAVLELLPFKLISADKAAQVILRGVARNKAIIVFPFYGRMLWWLQRMNHSLINPISRKMVKDFRASK